MMDICDLRKMPFASIDLHFASYVDAMVPEGGGNPLVFAAAAIASAAVRSGHSCCDVNVFSGKSFRDFFGWISKYRDHSEIPFGSLPFPSAEILRKNLVPPRGISLSADSADESAENIPLVLDSSGRLYLNRYFFYEKELAERILNLSRSGESDFHPRKEDFNGIITFFRTDSGNGKVNWQKFAAFLAGFSNFTVITGGPGTGKTTVVAALLAFILETAERNGEPYPKIALCAPTGKAAARLAESIRKSIPSLRCSGETLAELNRITAQDGPEKNCTTLHSLLVPIRNTPDFRRNETFPLDADILLADEASMISTPLMCRLLRALKPGAKLILLGDKDQLPSVDSGCVLSDLCRYAGFNMLSPDRKAEFAALTDSPADQIAELHSPPEHPLDGHIAELKDVWRFREDSAIGKISAMIRDRRDASGIRKLIQLPGREDFAWQEIPRNPSAELRKFFGNLPSVLPDLLETHSLENMMKFYRLLDNHKILCGINAGVTGTDELNKICRRIFSMRERYADGLPVMVLENDRRTGLANGDIGIVWTIGEEMKIWFPASYEDSSPKSFYSWELPAHEPVFAMTVHKSQGSGFDNVLISLPGFEVPLLTRELLYTAITRARKRVDLWCPGSMLETILNREVIRHSGLAYRLRAASPRS